ncbi:MAG: nucleotidyltransferase domain-containing protein [Vulcanimicrobiota bacterium]
MNETFRRAAEGFKRRALELFPSRLKRVVVFGSVARGEAGPDSDLDLCVLVDEVDPQLHERLFSLLHPLYEEFDYAFPIAPMVMAESHFERLLQLERRLAQDIQREGIPV